jgi:hypothetical protein
MQKKLASMAVVILDRKTGQKNLHQPGRAANRETSVKPSFR